MEYGNVHDIYAVAVTRGEDIVVGHLPRNISYTMSFIFTQSWYYVAGVLLMELGDIQLTLFKVA